MAERLIYMDNAATSFPKPAEVMAKMIEAYSQFGVSSGRSGYDLAVEAELIIHETRKKVARFFGCSDPQRVVFAANATDALNLAIQGLVGSGDHIVSTKLEHNSVLRPLYHLRRERGISYDLVRFDSQGLICPGDIEKKINDKTVLVIVNHASNVLGTVQSLDEIGRMCSKQGVPLLVDAAQSAGHVPLEMEKCRVGAVAFTGHKAMLGPSGIGGLVISPELNIRATRFGGTGYASESLEHPGELPYRLEAGTLNLLGILGLSAGLDYLDAPGTAEACKRKMILAGHLYDGLSEIPGVIIHSPEPGEPAVPVLTCSVEGWSPGDVADVLDGDYGIAVRSGLHCAPLVHAEIGTSGEGAVRFSLGIFTSEDDIEQVIKAMQSLI